MTDPEEPVSIVELVAPLLDSTRTLAEAIARLLLPS